MTINTKLSIGDKIYTPYHNKPLTIGQIRVEITDSKGINDGYVEPNIDCAFDNFEPQQNYVESYMCEETGIGSGSIYIWGESAFATAKEAKAQRIKNEKAFKG